jgi:hypothetical protein
MVGKESIIFVSRDDTEENCPNKTAEDAPPAQRHEKMRPIALNRLDDSNRKFAPRSRLIPQMGALLAIELFSYRLDLSFAARGQNGNLAAPLIGNDDP